MGHPTVTRLMLFICTVLVFVGAELLMQQTNTNNRTCCGSIVTYTCTVTESSSLVWAVGPIAVAFVSVSSINTPVVRGEYEFVLVSVAPNLNNPTFSDFISTLTVTADGAVNGTVIECDDLINPSNATLMLNSTEQILQVDGDCVTECPDGGGDVRVAWTIISGLCGWDTIIYDVTLTCMINQDSCPSGPTTNDIATSLNTSEVFFNQTLLGGDWYTFQIIATNLCGETSTQICEATCRDRITPPVCRSGDITCDQSTRNVVIAVCSVGVAVAAVFVAVGVICWKYFIPKVKNRRTLNPSQSRTDAGPSASSGTEHSASSDTGHSASSDTGHSASAGTRLPVSSDTPEEFISSVKSTTALFDHEKN